MLDVFTTPESVAVLSLLMVGANEEIKLEELSSMIDNPFFAEHVAEKIGPHKEFLNKYNEVKKILGKNGLEKKATTALKGAFPALQIKTVAMMSIIAGADEVYDQQEKELLARVASELGVALKDVDPEMEKMQEGIIEQAAKREKLFEKAQDEAKAEAEAKLEAAISESPAEEKAEETPPEPKE